MSLSLHLIRLSGKGGALQLGILKVNEEICFTTAELPWNDNIQNSSCIPLGEYQISKAWSSKWHKYVWFVIDVPDRAAIEIHVGNFTRNTDGCILIGNSFVKMEEGRTIGNSQVAFDKLMEITKDYSTGALLISDDDFTLLPI